ncbi:hypothetical protein [Scytonema hofmannii]|uniref:hypothetical protein n=1 Tax=Scytonema hofmannii TaxID=34078 RepID=UPI003AF31DBF
MVSNCDGISNFTHFFYTAGCHLIFLLDCLIYVFLFIDFFSLSDFERYNYCYEVIWHCVQNSIQTITSSQQSDRIKLWRFNWLLQIEEQVFPCQCRY